LRPQPVTSMDILPTLAELCDVDLPEKPLDGKSLVTTCQSSSAKPPHEQLYWVYQEAWAVREGPWKVIGHGEEIFLANLAQDPTETTDFSTSNPHMGEYLIDRYNHWIIDDIGMDENVQKQAPVN
ncbi:MAG: hypothetical protein VX733_10445, partial [Candidatus Latescibacterota bacterium]|nr:hypothetical protein [Candidatus Latescibacterota bacterium]